jgi:RNA polymerase sigma-54 factor
MALELKLSQKLSQTLVMTPQLQQAIKLLQLGREEYMEMIERELLENPLLEEVSDDSGSSKFENRSSDSGSWEESKSESNTAGSVSEKSSNFETSDNYQNFNDGSDGAQGNYPNKFNSDDERYSVESIASAEQGLASHLYWQIRTTDFDNEDHAIAAQIIGNIDKNGYLCCTLEEISEICHCSVERVESVLQVIQTLDPAGVAARDLRECLLIQLDQLGQANSLAWKLASNHLDKIELRQFDQIAKAENVTADEIFAAVKEILKLEPRPGRPFTDENPIYITPDVYVRKVGDDYLVSLNENGIPKLRLSSYYQQILSGEGVSTAPDKEYLQDRIRAASWLIKSIEQRQQTIFKVTSSIVEFQREFLEHGVSKLRPLVLREIAEKVGMHESTISRVTTNKYVHTPQGVFELKFFFSSGLKSGSGEVSSESVKERIREMISKEDPRKPLSDQELVRQLKSEGIDIARRTVAKYREMINILSSSRRKKLF